MKNICIFFPDKNIGGGPYWLTGLAKELAKDENYKVYYIDYKNGFARTLINCEHDKVTFLDYGCKQRYCIFDEECILFMPIYDLHRMPIINTKSKVLFFNWHNLCLPALKSTCKFLRYDMNYFLTEVFSNNAMVFCDGSHRSKCNMISGLNFKSNYVPVILPPKRINLVSDIVNKNEINISILGRLVSDKVWSVNNIIKQAKNYKTDKKIIIHIIGDGKYKKDIITKVSKNIEIRFCGVLKNEELDKYLLENVDVHFAMGTSVLNGGSLGIPSYIIPSYEKKFDCDKFVFLPETTDFIMGYYPNQIKTFNLKTQSFESIIDDIYINNKKSQYGQQCFKYYHENHLPEYACLKLKEYLDNTSLEYSTVAMIKYIQDTKKYVKRTPIPFQYKIMDKIWRRNKRKIGDFSIIKDSKPLRYKFLNYIENVLLEKDIITEDLLQGFKDCV